MVRKNYKKFVATAATATLVASAIAPVASADVNTAAFTDVPADYKDAVDFLVSNNIAAGKSETQFDIHGNITRGDFASILAKAAGLVDGDAPSAGFSDVPDSRALVVNSLKAAGVINGVSATQFGYAQNIKRGDAAKMITKAFDLKTSTEESKFTDVSADYEEAVNALVKAGVTNGKTSTQFGVHDSIKRGDFAKWIYALKDLVVDGEDGGETPTSGITSVKSINDTTVEVTFAEALNQDFVREAERNGEYFRLYLEGDSVSSDNAVKSDSINFSSDRKTATFTLGETINGDDADQIESGKRYYIALTDGDSAAATVEYTYGPTELKASASKPNFDVNATSDKIIVNFGEEMKSSALKAENYEVFDNGGRSLGKLNTSDFVKDLDNGNGEWVDASTKRAVEFKLNDSNKLKAGETYKLRVHKDVQTDDNKNLSDNDRTITVRTPSIADAKPKAVTARTTAANEIVVSFDQKIGDIQQLIRQVEVKTATNKTIDVTGVANGDADNELRITVGSGDDNELKIDETYRVSLPANITTNAVFTNAANDAISNITAQAQENVEIKSVRAELKADPKDRKQANLHLEFDQRPDISDFTGSNNDIKIVDGSKVYELSNVQDVKYTGGKSIVLEGVNADGAFVRNTDSSESFKPEQGKSYTLEVEANTISTDAFGSITGVKNQSKLKATFGGVSVSAPAIDKVTLVSANEVKVEFKDNVTSVNKDDIQVKGFERLSNGKFAQVTLTGDDITATTSGRTLTLKTSGDRLFNTGIAGTDIKIATNSFSSQGSQVANDEVKINDIEIDSNDFVDNAAPVLVGAYADNTSNDSRISFTFTEDIITKGTGTDIAKLFSVSNAANNSVGESTDLDNVSGDSGYVEFNKPVFEEDTIMSRIEVKYAGSNTFYIQDEKGNKAQNVTIKGVQGENPAN